MGVVAVASTRILDRFEILEVVGRGSFGRVLRVADASGEYRALKVVPPGPHEAMLLDEFEQLAKLRHPSLPRVFEVGRTTDPIEDIPAGAPFFLAEWIAGTRSDAIVASADAPLDASTIWSFLADVAGALATIHAAGLVHADVAPQNLLVDATRTVLVDLGLASAADPTARGTPAYMAPEAFANRIDPRSDLYSLGASTIRLITNRPPFEAATLGELVQRIVAGAPARALPGIPAPLANLIARLVERDPDARPPSALAVLDELDQLAPAIAPALARRARPKVGAPPAGATWLGARPIVDAIAKQLAGDLVVAIAGPASAGGRTIADAALQRWQLDRVARTRSPAILLAGSIDEVATALGVAAAPTDRAPSGWLERIARRARATGVGATERADLILVDASDDPRGTDLVTALSRSPGDRPVVILVERAPAPRAGLAIHTAPLLDVDGIAQLAHRMLGATPPAAWSHGLLAASGGLALTAIELVRSITDEKDPFKVDWSARTSAGAAELRAKQLKALAASGRRVAAALAAWGGRARIDRVLAGLRAESKPALLADATELERAGLARRRGDDLAIDRATADAIEAAVGAEGIAAHAAAALSLVPVWIAQSLDAGERDRRDEPRPAARERFLAASAAWLAPLLERAPLDRSRADLACDVAEQLLARGRADRALVLAKRAISIAPARANLIATRAASATGAYKDATAFARAAQSAGADAIEAQLALARAAQRGGDLATAESTLASLHAAHPTHAEVAGTYARLLVTRSRYADARAVALGIDVPSQPRTDARGDVRTDARGDARTDAGGRGDVHGRGDAGDTRNNAGDVHGRGDAGDTRGDAGAVHGRGDARSDAGVRDNAGDTARTSAAPSFAGELTGLRAEAAGLAAFYVGDLDDADAAFAALEVGAVASGDAATVGRALSLRGMVAQQRGQLTLASERYREAAQRLDEVGELHAAAVAELNLGTVLSERGRASEALPRLAAAGRVFAELGATTELCAAELNRGNALLAVGQLDEGRRAAETALARSEGAPHLRAFALLVLGDARARLGDAGGAARSYREALGIANERNDAHAQISAYIALAEAGHHDADGIDVDALCASADDRDRWTIARGKLALHDGDGRASGAQRALDASTRANTAADRATGAKHASDHGRGSRSLRAIDPPEGFQVDYLELAHACADVGERAAAADRLERAFRAHAVASGLAQRARDPALAGAQAERARANHATLVAAAAPAFRAALEADPDLARLPGVARAATPPARAEQGHLRRLLTLSRRLNTEASVERILDDVIDTAIELTDAERGFLLLRQADGELASVVSRNFTSGDLAMGGASVSRSIAERAAQTGEPVVTVDAGIDERFGMAASVAALRLRSVLAVPLRQRGTITGCIYVDHRLRGGAFDDGAASMLGELADIAAIAIENARLTTDLRATTKAVDELNSRLSAELADRDAELVRVKSDLPDRDRLRHRYDKIVGRSPAMLRMLEIVDRAAATSLPVVIVGESGTGKELVARALHDNGPRRDGAFVAINCSAVPEPLLESELFGHVRGAFTGAERDRRGLFEVADGGTLFLDEIADTSVAMQAKLLRVLQDGVIRRVGDTATHKVDVRVITASQRTLADLAAAGRFREDLRFRLEVIQVPVPPLRDRDGDVPLLVESLLARLASGRAPKLTRAAMRALGQHRWPGNVRELENALARGVAMGGDVIDVGDLPEVIANAAARPEPAKPAVGEDLRLKPALASTEQAYITAAMARAKGNQTVAARLLGLSRFGLQKKLRRLSGEDTDDE
ncbi:MAG: sigma 54-interacting transcriptional regulator [Kofleriaceae bacterium]